MGWVVYRRCNEQDNEDRGEEQNQQINQQIEAVNIDSRVVYVARCLLSLTDAPNLRRLSRLAADFICFDTSGWIFLKILDLVRQGGSYEVRKVKSKVGPWRSCRVRYSPKRAFHYISLKCFWERKKVLFFRGQLLCRTAGGTGHDFNILRSNIFYTREARTWVGSKVHRVCCGGSWLSFLDVSYDMRAKIILVLIVDKELLSESLGLIATPRQARMSDINNRIHKGHQVEHPVATVLELI